MTNHLETFSTEVCNQLFKEGTFDNCFPKVQLQKIEILLKFARPLKVVRLLKFFRLQSKIKTEKDFFLGNINFLIILETSRLQKKNLNVYT